MLALKVIRLFKWHLFSFWISSLSGSTFTLMLPSLWVSRFREPQVSRVPHACVVASGDARPFSSAARRASARTALSRQIHNAQTVCQIESPCVLGRTRRRRLIRFNNTQHETGRTAWVQLRTIFEIVNQTAARGGGPWPNLAGPRRRRWWAADGRAARRRAGSRRARGSWTAGRQNARLKTRGRFGVETTSVS